jgi:hypothetical protein
VLCISNSVAMTSLMQKRPSSSLSCMGIECSS